MVIRTYCRNPVRNNYKFVHVRHQHRQHTPCRRGATLGFGHACFALLHLRTTRWDDDFDLSSTLRYLRAEGDDPDELLLQRYAAVHEQHITIDLAGVAKLASSIELLEEEFVDYASFRRIRETNAYSTIVTFTTPAISESKDLAFLELWTEDGRYAQMGCWWWLQMRLTSRGWNVDWKNMHAMS